MTEIIPGKLWLGDIKDAHSVEIVGQIDRVLSVTSDWPVCDHKVPNCYHVPFDDNTYVPAATIHRAVRVIYEALIKNERILVHCTAGISRSPMIVACYLVQASYYPTYMIALRSIQEKRNIVAPFKPISVSAIWYLPTAPTMGEPYANSD